MILRTLLLTASVLAAKDSAVWVLTKDGASKEITTKLSAIRVNSRSIPLTGILSVHSAEPASAAEETKIVSGIAAIQGANRKDSDAAVEALAFLGLPALTPLLKAYKDTDQHEPRPLYRLFERIVPVNADHMDRTLSMVRLSSGEIVRGKIETFSLGDGTKWEDIRVLAVRRRQVSKRVNVHSIQHSTQIEFFDTAIVPSAASKATVSATGFTRLSWATDGWATDPDGLKVPGPNYKTNLVDGHPFGALVGRWGAAGEVFKVGAAWTSASTKPARLQLAINDNRHWQNNLGSYKVNIQVTEAYDLGEAQ
ncbi:MAG: hypothetical protein FJW30_13270 [Acidobacteria bacterium]|nr:hypothetical protein [Acidobacteriota bacterium]